MDLGAESALPRLLLTAALQRNTVGPVLFTTTRPERTVLAASTGAGSAQSITETAAFNELVATVRAAHPELLGKA